MNSPDTPLYTIQCSHFLEGKDCIPPPYTLPYTLYTPFLCTVYPPPIHYKPFIYIYLSEHCIAAQGVHTRARDMNTVNRTEKPLRQIGKNGLFMLPTVSYNSDYVNYVMGLSRLLAYTCKKCTSYGHLKRGQTTTYRGCYPQYSPFPAALKGRT